VRRRLLSTAYDGASSQQILHDIPIAAAAAAPANRRRELLQATPSSAGTVPQPKTNDEVIVQVNPRENFFPKSLQFFFLENRKTRRFS
jgi:hypothetical protein